MFIKLTVIKGLSLMDARSGVSGVVEMAANIGHIEGFLQVPETPEAKAYSVVLLRRGGSSVELRVAETPEQIEGAIVAAIGGTARGAVQAMREEG